MPKKTPEDAKADYAVAVNFNLQLPCKNYKKIHLNDIELQEDFKKEALYHLYDLVNKSLTNYEEGKSLPISFEVYDADLYSQEHDQEKATEDSISEPEYKKS